MDSPIIDRRRRRIRQVRKYERKYYRRLCPKLRLLAGNISYLVNQEFILSRRESHPSLKDVRKLYSETSSHLFKHFDFSDLNLGPCPVHKGGCL